MTLSVPDTGMAVLIDTGESKDIHPQSKDIAGERLARIALAKTYGKADSLFRPDLRLHEDRRLPRFGSASSISKADWWRRKCPPPTT